MERAAAEPISDSDTGIGAVRLDADLGAVRLDPPGAVGFEALCSRHHRRLVGLLALHVGDLGVAEELAQEALVRLHLHWDRVGTTDRPEMWLNRVAVNLANSWWRRRFAERRANERRTRIDATGPTLEAADRLAVWSAVSALPRRQRTVIVWRFYVGLPVAETAIAMRCREGTVKSLTHQALACSRVALSDLTEED